MPGNQRSEMGMKGARDRAGALAEGTIQGQLGRDGFADKLAFVGEFVQKFGQLFFHLESDHFGFRVFARHKRVPAAMFLY
jgi:hypothetical protein